MKRKHFLSILLFGCIFFDVSRNSSLVGYFAGDNDGSTQWMINYASWLSAAFVLALLPVALDNVTAKRAALLSAVFSVCAVLMGHFAGEMADTAHEGSKAFHHSEAVRLNQELAKCDSMPASVCSSVDVRQQIKINSEKLAQLESSATLKSYDVTFLGQTINPPKVFQLICLLLVSAFVPYFSAAIAEELRSGTVSRPESRPDRSKSKDERTKVGTGKGKTQDVPDEKESAKLLECYKVLIKKGKVRRDDLARTAGLGNGKTGWWLRNCKPSNVIKLGEVKNDRD
jgi:hypothetical protein